MGKPETFQRAVTLVWLGLRQVDPDAKEEQAIFILMDCLREMEKAAPCLLVELLTKKRVKAADILNPPPIDCN